MKVPKKKIFIIILSVLALLAILYEIVLHISFATPGTVYGVTFDSEYAGYLQLNPVEVLSTILNDWHFRYIRIGVHWNKVEPTNGNFNFSEFDTYMAMAASSSAHMMLAIGQKTPRWPECHLPDWARKLSPDQYRAALLAYITATVEHYKNNPALESWQVENEPFLAFGANCPGFTVADLQQEIALVKKLDPNHPIMVGDSGELATWLHTADAGDLFGTTMYHIVWNPLFGYFSYDWLPAAYYRFKLWLMHRSPESTYVIELQAEPWVTNTEISKMPLSQQYKSMNINLLKKNIAYADSIGLPRVYLWGAEWWYWVKVKKGVPDFYNFAAQLNR